MSRFQQLTATLEQLAQQAYELDKQRGDNYKPLFDERLFPCKSKRLFPCVEETQITLESILREEKTGQLDSSRAEYLTDKLVAQISAIQREIATTGIRRAEPKHHRYMQSPLNELQQHLAQHCEWERRLIEMVKEKQRKLHSLPPFQRVEAEQDLLTTEQRLKRCQEAKRKIENKITYRERYR